MRRCLTACPVVCLLLTGLALPVEAQDPTDRHDVLDIHHLPLGNGRISTQPQAGYVMACPIRGRRAG